MMTELTIEKILKITTASGPLDDNDISFKEVE